MDLYKKVCDTCEGIGEFIGPMSGKRHTCTDCAGTGMVLDEEALADLRERTALAVAGAIVTEYCREMRESWGSKPMTNSDTTPREVAKLIGKCADALVAALREGE
jgi:hypothetical protein